MLVLGFEGGEFRGEIADELERLRESDTIRVLNVAVVFKDVDGQTRFAESVDDAADRKDLQDVADALEPGSAAAIALLEHRWAIPLREAIARAGGRAIVDAWVAEEELAALGLPR